MARLIHSAISSLDGYIEDIECTFDWLRASNLVTGLSRTRGKIWHQPAVAGCNCNDHNGCQVG